MPEGPKSRFRRYASFSLRTTFIAVTVFGIWLGLHWRSVRQQRASVEALSRHGVSVTYDYQLDDRGPFSEPAESPVPAWLLRTFGRDHFHDVVMLAMPDIGKRQPATTDETEAVLSHLQGLPELETLHLGPWLVKDDNLRQIAATSRLQKLFVTEGWRVTDEGVRHLANLKQLQVLSLSGSQMTDDSLHVLQILPQLTRLQLEGNRLTEVGLSHIGGMSQLRFLHLGQQESWASDVGLSHLIQLERLEYLRLEGGRFTDEGLWHLSQLPSLQHLDLTGSEIQLTDEGLGHLGRLTQLQTLGIRADGAQVSEVGTASLQQLKGLKSLMLEGVHLTGVALEPLCQLKQLKLLSLYVSDLAPSTLISQLPQCQVHLESQTSSVLPSTRWSELLKYGCQSLGTLRRRETGYWMEVFPTWLD